MKIKLLAFAVVLAASTGTGFADSGIFGFGIELDGTGASATNNGVVTLYALNNGGTTRLTPLGSTSTLNTSWTSASDAVTPTFSLGTFTEGSDSLELLGGSMLTFKNGDTDVTGSTLNYLITPSGVSSSSFTPITLNFNEDNVSGNTGDQRWATESQTINLLAGLAPGTYTLDVYGSAPTLTDGNNGTLYASGDGNNYGATFTVLAAPEPGTWALMLGGLGMVIFLQRLRRKSVV